MPTLPFFAEAMLVSSKSNFLREELSLWHLRRVPRKPLSRARADRLCSARQRTVGRPGRAPDAYRCCRYRKNGRGHCRPADGSRPRRRGVESHAGQGQGGRAAQASPRRLRELAKTSEAVITILTDGAAIEAVYNGPSGLLSGDVTGKLFIEMSTVPPKAETALLPKVAPRAPTSSNVRSAARPRRHGRASCSDFMAAKLMPRARAADPQPALPQGRALRAGRRRLVDEARDQSAADGRLGRPRRGLRHRPRRRLDAKAAAGAVCRKQSAPIMG